MKRLPAVRFLLVLLAGSLAVPMVFANELSDSINEDYQQHLAGLFDHFHRNPELSFLEFETAARLAEELRAVGFAATEGVGGTGVVAIMENGPGPLVMMRADMDGLPLEEKSGLPNASTVRQERGEDDIVPVMHACGHDVHITSLVGTARIMSRTRDQWSGTLMLIGQPAEEIGSGAKAMKSDGLWDRFGKPDYALGFHVGAGLETGKLDAVLGSPNSGSDSVDILIHGVGAHGASPHAGIDPIVLGSQIIMALQTVVSRELPPREAGLITVGSFHAGTKHNIIPDSAFLQLTVRNDNFETRKLLLDGLRRVAENMGRVAGLPDDKLPEITVKHTTPPNMNHIDLTRRLRGVWGKAFGEDVFNEVKRQSMYGEDFAYYGIDPDIPATYFAVGGTRIEDVLAAASGGPPIAPHHSPLFKIEPEYSVKFGVEATVLALRELLQE